MSPDDIIKVGERVSVYWDSVQNVFDAEVLFAPNAFGEPWILKESNGTIHYVMVYSRMTRQRRSEKPPEKQFI